MNQFQNFLLQNIKQIDQALNPANRITECPDPAKIKKLEEENAEMKKMYDRKFAKIEQVEETLSMYPKIRKKIESMKKVTEKKIKKFKKNQKVVWENLVLMRSLEEEAGGLEEQLEEHKLELQDLKEKSAQYQRQDKQEWDTLQFVFQNFHNLFEKENELSTMLNQLGQSFNNLKQEYDICFSVNGSVQEARELLEGAVEKLDHVVECVKREKAQKAPSGLTSLKNLSTSAEEVYEGLGISQNAKIKEAGKMLTQSFKRLCDGKSIHPLFEQDEMFKLVNTKMRKKKKKKKKKGKEEEEEKGKIPKLKRNQITPLGEKEFLIYGMPQLVMRMYREETGRGSTAGSKKNEMDIKSAERLVSELKEELKEVIKISEWIKAKESEQSDRLFNLRRNCEHVKQDLIKEQKSLIQANRNVQTVSFNPPVPMQVPNQHIYYI